MIKNNSKLISIHIRTPNKTNKTNKSRSILEFRLNYTVRNYLVNRAIGWPRGEIGANSAVSLKECK